MNYLNFNIDSELEIMEKYHLTSNEIFFTRILLLAKEGYAEDYIVRFMTLPSEVRGSLLDMLISLQNKGIVLKSYKLPKKGDSFDINLVPINQNVDKTFHKASFDLGIDLFQTYPMFGNINGTTVSLRGVTKKFNSLEDFYRYYGKVIKWNPDVHNEIIELIKWAKENTNYLNMSIASFVIERKWEELKALKNGDIVNINYDTIKLL